MLKKKTVRGVIAERLLPFFEENGRGRILMVNSSGIYLTLQERIFLLCPMKFGTVPMGIALEHFSEVVQRLSLERGQWVLGGGARLIFPGGELELHLLAVSDPRPAECIPDPGRCLAAARSLAGCGKNQGLAVLVRPLFLGEVAEEEENPLCTHAGGLLEQLLKGILWDLPEELESGVCGLLGLGPGLTPSGDDVLMGMIYGLNRSFLRESRPVKTLCGLVLREAEERTGRISRAYLEAIISGCPFERMAEAWRGLAGLEPWSEERLLEIGSNSGAEMLMGLLLAARCIFYFREGTHETSNYRTDIGTEADCHCERHLRYGMPEACRSSLCRWDWAYGSDL